MLNVLRDSWHIPHAMQDRELQSRLLSAEVDALESVESTLATELHVARQAHAKLSQAFDELQASCTISSHTRDRLQQRKLEHLERQFAAERAAMHAKFVEQADELGEQLRLAVERERQAKEESDAKYQELERRMLEVSMRGC